VLRLSGFMVFAPVRGLKKNANGIAKQGDADMRAASFVKASNDNFVLRVSVADFEKMDLHGFCSCWGLNRRRRVDSQRNAVSVRPLDQAGAVVGPALKLYMLLAHGVAVVLGAL
jgi:hypothetical protein